MARVKYRNVKGTFNLGQTWIVKHIEAIISDESGSEFTIGVLNKEGPLKIDKALFREYFQESGEPTEDDMIEFESRNHKISKSRVVKLIRSNLPPASWKVFESALKKAHLDAYTAAGNQKTITIDEYNQFRKSGKVPGGLKGFGDPVLNRAPRWTPVANFQEWLEGKDPAPLGIRESDHARLRDCNQIFLELMGQVFSMDHSYSIPEEISKFVGWNVVPRSHACSYCGSGMSVSAFEEQTYRAKEHPINFCHRDPSDSAFRTRPGNIYFGHTSCNRIQGGLSELDRIKDGLRLLALHFEQYLPDADVRRYLSEFRDLK